jgi:LYR motif-containing protein 4
MLRTSRSFSSYNFREYFLRRTKSTFRTIQVCPVPNMFRERLTSVPSSPLREKAERDPEKVRAMYADAVKEFSVLRRSAVVNQLYGGWRLAVEDQKGVRTKV